MIGEFIMIPREVYNHIKFGSGGDPGAVYQSDGYSYILEQTPNGKVICTRFGPNFENDWNDKEFFPLSEIPATTESDWEVYFEHEC